MSEQTLRHPSRILHYEHTTKLCYHQSLGKFYAHGTTFVIAVIQRCITAQSKHHSRNFIFVSLNAQFVMFPKFYFGSFSNDFFHLCHSCSVPTGGCKVLVHFFSILWSVRLWWGAHAIWFPLYFQLPDFVNKSLCQRHTQYLSSLKCVSTLLRDSHEIANLSIGLNVDHC